jgi:pimeloyl-ACP methyl ester carboxylesterase
VLLVGTALLLAAIVLLPVWYRIVPAERFELPPPGRRVTLGGGVAVNLLERGSGPPVVLVHGLPGTAYHFERMLGALAERGRRALAYDRVGYGRSDPRPDDDFTVDANARELLALLEAEGLRDATVVGWSFGGKTAMTAALHDPSRIGCLVLLASAGRWDDPPPPNPVIGAFFSAPVMEWAASVPPLYRGMQAGMGEVFFSGAPVPAWFTPLSRASFDLAETRRSWREESLRFRFDGPDPSGIERPILILHGDADRITPPSIAEGIHAAAPRSELQVLAGGSHAFPVTHTDWTAERIAAFSASAAP